MTVYKYPLELKDEQTLTLPRGAKILCTKCVRGQLCLYALVDPAVEAEARKFAIVGTGYSLPDSDSAEYIDTVFYRTEQLVFHIFELK